METPKNKQGGNCVITVLKSIWNAVFRTGGAIKGCARPGKTAQDIRDDALKKCPWVE